MEDNNTDDFEIAYAESIFSPEQLSINTAVSVYHYIIIA